MEVTAPLFVLVSIVLGIQLCFIFGKIWKRACAKYLSKYKRNLYRYTKARHNLLSKEDFIIGKGLFNNSCHKNSVQAIKEGSATKIIMCVCVVESSIFMHYINVTEDGKYVDNTLGWQYKDADYFFIRDVEENEYSELPYYITSMNDKNSKHHSNWLFRRTVRNAIR